MVKIVLNSWFTLPWVGKEVYADLMKAKVKRDTRLGFCFTSETNVARALSVLSTALEEPVELARACFICDRPLDDSKNDEEMTTICKECEHGADSYDYYIMKFAKLMESA
jgi:hypothetical protein